MPPLNFGQRSALKSEAGLTAVLWSFVRVVTRWFIANGQSLRQPELELAPSVFWAGLFARYTSCAV